VASPAGGIGAVVRNEETGLLVPEGDSAALAAALGRLLDDRTFAGRIGAAGRIWARTEGTWDRALDAFEAAYEFACRRSNGRA
jgi:glycosyltransferase involved in cell wall biosynthesis